MEERGQGVQHRGFLGRHSEALAFILSAGRGASESFKQGSDSTQGKLPLRGEQHRLRAVGRQEAVGRWWWASPGQGQHTR